MRRLTVDHKTMRYMNNKTESDQMRPEYGFSYYVRGKHYRAYQQGTNDILLDPGTAKIFKISSRESCAKNADQFG